MKITILGVGRVGSTLASHLLASPLKITDLCIYDDNRKKMLGEYLDLINFATLVKKPTKITMGYDLPADICIITAGMPRNSGERSFDFERNFDITHSCLLKCPEKAKVFLVTNPAERLAKRLKKTDSHKIIPIGEHLDKARRKLTKNPEEIADMIIDNKGYSNFGCIGEIILRLKKETRKV
jgi:malate/lactate dehydrogenase